MKINMSLDTFETSDFQTAIFLYAKELTLLAIQPIDTSNKCTFIFKKNKRLISLLQNFWSGKEKIEPMSLLNAERELKRRLYSGAYKLT